MKLGRCLLFFIASLFCTEAAAFDSSEVQGFIEKSLQEIQQTIAIRRAKHKLVRRSIASVPQISTVSFASYMNNNMEDQPVVANEQTAFKPKCGSSQSSEEEKPRAKDVAASGSPEGQLVGSGGNANDDNIVRGPASESEPKFEPVQGY